MRQIENQRYLDKKMKQMHEEARVFTNFRSLTRNMPIAEVVSAAMSSPTALGLGLSGDDYLESEKQAAIQKSSIAQMGYN